MIFLINQNYCIVLIFECKKRLAKGVKIVPKISAKVEVELFQEHLIEVTFTALTRDGWGKWEGLVGAEYADEYKLTLPHTHFAYKAKVDDVICGQWNNGNPKWENTPQFPRSGSIIVILESPHKHEYDYTDEMKPRRPLMNPSSQTRFQNQFERLISSIQDGPDLHHDPQIVLCNPIQFQTSLHHLYQPNDQGKTDNLRKAIRNATWRGLWGCKKDGRFPFQEDLINRLAKREPCIIINACTQVLQDELTHLLVTLPYPVFEATNHPAYWNSATRIYRVKESTTT
jgi:hypothetical protein